MEVVCPSCSSSLEAPDNIGEGTHLKCPMCGARFAYVGSTSLKGNTMIEVTTSKPEGCCQRKFSAVKFCFAHKVEIAVGLAALMGVYICVIITRLFVATQRMEKRLRWIESDVSSIESDVGSIKSDVDEIEGDVSHIKIYGVQIDR